MVVRSHTLVIIPVRSDIRFASRWSFGNIFQKIPNISTVHTKPGLIVGVVSGILGW